jgi:hypothetical protein
MLNCSGGRENEKKNYSEPKTFSGGGRGLFLSLVLKFLDVLEDTLFHCFFDFLVTCAFNHLTKLGTI